MISMVRFKYPWLDEVGGELLSAYYGGEWVKVPIFRQLTFAWVRKETI